MEIKGLPSPAPRPDKGKGQTDAGSGSNFETESTRVDTTGAALPTARPGRGSEATGERGDRLEISTTGRLMQPEGGASASTERMAELKQRLVDGSLSNRESIELAARRILEGGR
ncbi:MAG: hypothetical protein R3F34_16120 [Planctomycetota bacterium]